MIAEIEKMDTLSKDKIIEMVEESIRKSGEFEKRGKNLCQ